ncbi:major facilitator superfamily transporter [Colletotrichum graminicola M1.001]|uniref:Major facilitator superfamily transporter n=1 Tax=Colletotrichum graminicola (strain M1.001 / M2 / FGSC 10212) TaxID=645133 RepID=E3QHI0_COLGM|nr:major facilitator superfamily transporter [Colletotrichum graminicola M1.001]EFQ30151.1 major facilitator superfamily transporter [Colletotrichum graminicola M1.001]
MSNLVHVKNDARPRAETAESRDAEVVLEEHQAHGTVQLLRGGSVVLIPTPSPDPKDPLNLPTWHKYLFIFIVGAYSAIAVLVPTGLGTVFPSVLKEYPPEDASRATDLLTFPTLFMAIGNLFLMPLSVVLGRRPVFLASLVLLVASGLWCAFSGSLSSHIAGRNIYSLAAGQSEALAPLIIEEMHFLHERSAKLSWFVGVQTVGTAAMFVATASIVPAWGIKWWYLIATFINAAVLVLAFFFVVETKFDRPRGADKGVVHPRLDQNGNVNINGDTEMVVKVLTRETHIPKPQVFGPRTWRHDLRIFHFRPDWSQAVAFYKETAQSLCLPSIVWMLLVNGAFLGIYVYQASTFATILMSPPYLFQYSWLGYVQLVQVLDCVLFVPLLGYGSDMVVRALSKWRNGTFQPEYRLIILSVPVLSAILSCVFFGQAGAYPDLWHWMTIVAPYNLGFFSFMGANLVGITYVVDSFPSKAGPLLLVLCAGRGFISFGLSYSTIPLINLIGYDGAMGIFAIISGVLGAIAFPVYYFGARIRMWATKNLWPEIAQ